MSKTGLLGCVFAVMAAGYNVYNAHQETDIFAQNIEPLESFIYVDSAMERPPSASAFPRTKFERLEDEIRDTPLFEKFQRQGHCSTKQFVADYFNQIAHIGLFITYDALSESEDHNFVARHRLSEKSDQHYQLYKMYHIRLSQKLCEQDAIDESLTLVATN